MANKKLKRKFSLASANPRTYIEKLVFVNGELQRVTYDYYIDDGHIVFRRNIDKKDHIEYIVVPGAQRVVIQLGGS